MASKRKRRRKAFDMMKSERLSGKVLSSNSNRRCMTDEEVESFLQAIDRKQKSFFGLVKLRKLNLNKIISMPWRGKKEEDQRRSKLTLLEYAALQTSNNSDYIVSCLLRGGADPRTREEHSTSKATITREKLKSITAPQQYLAQFHLHYSVWVVKRIVQMRAAGEALFATRSNVLSNNHLLSCSLCSITPVVNPLCLTCEKSHLICEDCCWEAMQQIDPQCNEEAIDFCPTCHYSSSLSSSYASISTSSTSTSTSTCWKPLNIGGKVSIDNLKQLTFPSSEESMLLFKAIPTKVSCNLSKNKQQKRQGKLQMTAMSKKDLRSQFLGTIKYKRTEQLWKSSEDGNYLRIVELLKSGVDVNAVDENGETAAFRAAALVACSGDTDEIAFFRSLLMSKEKEDQNNTASEELNSLSVHGCTVYIFFAAGIDLTLKTHEGHTLIDLFIYAPPPPLLLLSSLPTPTVVSLIPYDALHCGAGSFYIDDLFDDTFLNMLDELFQSIPTPNNYDDAQKGHKVSSTGKLNVDRKYSNTCAKRKYFRARLSNVVSTIQKCLEAAFSHMTCDDDTYYIPPTKPVPRMRYLNYDKAGGEMRPHVDLSKTYKEINGQCSAAHESTHTFLLHLRDSDEIDGGETVLLETLHKSPKKAEKKQRNERKQEESVGCMPRVLAAVRPKRGRFLMFPHICPHAGLAVSSPDKKLFLRGELY